MPGDADIARTARLIGDPSRARILAALADGRALPASVLASEAGVAASTASAHLASLHAGGLVAAERHGRHRHFRLAGPDVADALEALARLAPPAPVRSLREGTRAHALRVARTCYDHVAGALGTSLMAALLDDGSIAGGDGGFHPAGARADRLSGPGRDVPYELTPDGAARLRAFGVDVDALAGGRRPVVRYCVDWSEQRHHLAGALGAALCARLLALGWVRRAPEGRALLLSREGAEGLAERFGVRVEPSWVRDKRARPRAAAG